MGHVATQDLWMGLRALSYPGHVLELRVRGMFLAEELAWCFSMVSPVSHPGHAPLSVCPSPTSRVETHEFLSTAGEGKAPLGRGGVPPASFSAGLGGHRDRKSRVLWVPARSRLRPHSGYRSLSFHFSISSKPISSVTLANF